MQIGFSKKISEILLEDILGNITSNLIKYKKIKIGIFGTFSVRLKKSRVGRNPKTKVEAKVTSRKVVNFKPSLIFKEKINR